MQENHFSQHKTVKLRSEIEKMCSELRFVYSHENYLTASYWILLSVIEGSFFNGEQFIVTQI